MRFVLPINGAEEEKGRSKKKHLKFKNVKVSLQCHSYSLTNNAQLFSPQLERLWRHELQRVRRPVKIDDVELHRRVGLARLHAEQTVQTSDNNKHTSSQEGNALWVTSDVLWLVLHHQTSHFRIHTQSDSYTCAGVQKWSLCFVWRTWKIANQTWNMESGGRICIPSLLSSELQIHEELPLRQSNAAEISVVDVNWILGLNLGFFAVIFSFICFDFLCKTLHTERAPRKDPLREQQVPLSIKHNTKRL